MPTAILTDTSLLDRLTTAVARGVTTEERKKQRISFVYGNLPKGSAMSKSEVEKALEKLDDLEGKS